MKTYQIIIKYKGIFGGIDIINVTDKSGGKGDFYSYDGGCFRLYYHKDGKECNLSIPLDIIANIEIKEI